jgi:hypothetical protein
VFILCRAWQPFFLLAEYRQTQPEGEGNEEVRWLLLFSFYPLVKNTLIYHHHGKAVFTFVLGLLLISSNPAKEEEREFLTQMLSIVKVFSFRKAFSGPKVFPFRVNFSPAPSSHTSCRFLSKSPLRGVHSLPGLATIFFTGRISSNPA